ncbi:MAG: hypothetical protein IH969_08720 [Candidatus Krumholzibacteriota bacterium]|nr:hypothetical protein [Candidatus Krumholzibacteriota bacterium]
MKLINAKDVGEMLGCSDKLIYAMACLHCGQQTPKIEFCKFEEKLCGWDNSTPRP